MHSTVLVSKWLFRTYIEIYIHWSIVLFNLLGSIWPFLGESAVKLQPTILCQSWTWMNQCPFPHDFGHRSRKGRWPLANFLLLKSFAWKKEHLSNKETCAKLSPRGSFLEFLKEVNQMATCCLKFIWKMAVKIEEMKWHIKCTFILNWQGCSNASIKYPYLSLLLRFVW